MVKTRFRFEWSHQHRQFVGPSLEEESEAFQNTVTTINTDIARNSGIIWKPPFFFISALILVVTTGYTASYLLISQQNYRSGTTFLIATPIAAFAIIVAFSLRPNRVELINKFMERRYYEYQANSIQAGYDFSYVLLDAKTDIRVSRVTKRSFLHKLFQVAFHGAVLDYSKASAKNSNLKSVHRRKISSHTDGITAPFFLKKVNFEKPEASGCTIQGVPNLELNESERKGLQSSPTKHSMDTGSPQIRLKKDHWEKPTQTYATLRTTPVFKEEDDDQDQKEATKSMELGESTPVE